MSDTTTHAPAEHLGPDNQHLVSAFTDGGHEVDHLPATQLIVLLLALALLIFGTGVGVSQYFNLRISELRDQTATEAAARISAARAARATAAASWGEVDAEKGTWRMPVAEAAKRVASDPGLLRAAAPPAGFVHPDDVNKAGEAPAVVPEPVPVPAEPAPTEPAPAEPAPTDAAPTEPAPAEPAPVVPAPTEPAPTEGDAP